MRFAVLLALTIALLSGADKRVVFLERDGVISIEAERAARIVPSTFERYQTVHEWRLATDVEGYSGDGFMLIWPDERGEDGEGPNSPHDNSGAEMVYPIRVARAGLYHVFVRGLSMGGESNGLHVGVDGKMAGKEAGASNMSGFRPHHAWQWESKRKHGYEGMGVVRLTAGDHTLHVWSRDDGFRFDKIVLKTAPGAPVDLGPAESPLGRSF